jgi:hypothetical protein
LRRLVNSSATDGNAERRVGGSTFLEGRADERDGVVSARDNEETDETFYTVCEKIAAEFRGVFLVADECRWGFSFKVTTGTLRFIKSA